MNLKERRKIVKELFEAGKSSYQIAKILNISKRTIEKDEQCLREEGQIGYRNEDKKKKKHRPEQLLCEVNKYLDCVKKENEKYNDIYEKVALKSTWKKGKQTEDQVLLFSDMHTGMINKAPLTGEITYNQEIQEKELQSLLFGVNRFYQLYKPSYNIETFYIFGLGDLITNDRIYEGQKMEITCGVGKQIQQTFQYVSDFIKKLLEIYPKIVYVNIVGNHGRTTPKYITEDATSNFEHLIGQLLKERFERNKRVDIILPNDYSYTINIKGHRYLLTHGNAIRGATLNTIEKAAKEIALLVEKNSYDVINIGHFHSCYEFPISPTTTLLVNGCFIYKDSYAYTRLRKHSTAKQFLYNVSKKSPLHNLQKIDLRWKFR
ncbi:hypothetical protein DRN73_08200 [Candidatus Pacearchaeota archaeon]|nr:MAG: hypothetical protein DRN73_08200 [Candidatus Pacearchaeota archaeon]